MTEEKPNVKTTLTKDDQAGWYIFDNRFGATSCFYWNGDECAGCVGDGFPFYPPSDFFDEGDTNFRRLVEAPEPVTNEAAREELIKYLASINITMYAQVIAAKAAEIFGRVPEHKDEIAGLKQVIELQRANAEKRKQQIARQAEELNNWRMWAIGELSDEANALEEDDNAELRRKLSFVLSELANMTCQSDEIEELKAERDQLHKTREQLQLQQWHGSVVKLAKALGWDDASEQPLSEWLRAKLSPPQPEVIEGRGQAVTKEQEGWWIRESKEGLAPKIYAPELCEGDRFATGYRYMRCPTFPPRPAFVAPEKPELVLIRYQGQACWAVRDGDWYRRIGFTGGMSAGLCELLDPATGKPLTAGAAQ